MHLYTVLEPSLASYCIFLTVPTTFRLYHYNQLKVCLDEDFDTRKNHIENVKSHCSFDVKLASSPYRYAPVAHFYRNATKFRCSDSYPCFILSISLPTKADGILIVAALAFAQSWRYADRSCTLSCIWQQATLTLKQAEQPRACSDIETGGYASWRTSSSPSSIR